MNENLFPTKLSLHSQLQELQHNVAANPSDGPRLLFNFNRQTLLEALRALGIGEVIVTYSGYGDSGQIDEVDFGLPAEIADAASCAQVQLAVVRYSHTAANVPEQAMSLELEGCDLRSALCDLCDEAIRLTDHDGYENGDGGEGTLTIDVAAGKLLLEHSDFFTERDITEHEL